MKRVFCLLLALALLVLTVPPVRAAEADYGFSGKTISILGDSISTYENVSQGTAAQTTNSTIGGNALFYSAGKYGIYQADTWWQQTADALGMRVLVNNAWSGSCLKNPRSYGNSSMGYTDRSINLHDDTGDNAGEEPDIITVFLGTNDFTDNKTTLGSAADVDYDALITETEDGYTYATPENAAQAYAIMLYRITERYPNAEVYCLSLLPRENQGATNAALTLAFNDTICQIAAHYGACFVDLYNDSGITDVSACFDHYMADSLHPGPAGMDALTGCVVSALLKNSRYSTVKDSLHSVSYDLDGVVVTQGTVKTAVAGGSFSVDLEKKAGYVHDITVTMGGLDITESCYKNGTVRIENVTGDIAISAGYKLPTRDPATFRWESTGTELACTEGENPLTRLQGTAASSVFSKTRYSISTPIQLLHDQPWSVEWQSSGTWTDTTDGALLLAGAATSATADTPYLYRRHKSDFIALGVYTGGQYHNYGVPLSANGIDGTADHIYRMTNRIAGDGSNMIYLYVDDVLIGPMNHHYVGGTDKKETVDWVSGKDFYFDNMGTTPHTIGGCTLSYIQVWEAGRQEDRYYGRNALYDLENAAALLYAYDQIAAGVAAAAETITVYDGNHALTEDQLQTAMDAYRRDYAHHFWLGNSYQYASTSATVMQLLPTYTMTGDSLEAAKAAFEAEASAVLSGITDAMDEAEKALYLHDTLAGIITYEDTANAHNAYGALVEGKAVCEGYAEALQYLLQRVGLCSFIAEGAGLDPDTGTAVAHAWNYVRIDGAYYHVDLTWDDQGDTLYHAYFCQPDGVISEDHALAATAYPLPSCDSDAAGYFTGSDGYLNTYTPEALAALLKSNGLKAHVYIPGSVDTFLSWYGENILDIASQAGITGGFSYGYSRLGRELVLTLKKLCSHSYVGGLCSLCGSIDAPAGSTVQLTADLEAEEMTVPAGVTLDLNGHRLKVQTLASFGDIVDTAGSGRVQTEQLLLTQNSYLPIYDSTAQGYRFYAYTLQNLGARDRVFGFTLAFADPGAYALLASEGASGLDITVALSWESGSRTFAFDTALVQKFATLQQKYPQLQAALMLTVSGTDSLEAGTVLTVTPGLTAAEGQLVCPGSQMHDTVI